MSKLNAALAWARRGFPVFPLVENTKDPVFEGNWTELATTDETTIRAMWTDPVLRTERDYNIGCLCTDRVVVDIDVKNGKDGYNEYSQLSGNAWNTLTVRTPSGGYHLYFEGPDSGNSPISAAVDIRSHNGYVVAPGSTIDGSSYEIVRDMEPTWVPFNVERWLTPVAVRRSLSGGGADDTPAKVQAGKDYASTAPAAIEGQRGDEQTFIVAARLIRELGLSPQAAFDIMWEIYNPRCQPPWSLDELTQKVQNAADYGTADKDRLDPELLFGGLPFLPPPPIFEAAWGNALDPYETPERPWMIDRLLLLAKLTLILAAGGAGKSTLGLVIAAHLALGKDFGTWKVHTRCKSVIYNGEDDLTEQSRRLQAVCSAYGFDYDEVRKNILFLSDRDIGKLVVKGSGGAVENQAVVNGLIAQLQDPEVGLFIGDPLIDLHAVEEADSGDMNVVMRVLARIAEDANVAVLIMHHVTKAGSDKQEARIGNMDISRGSSGIVFKARIAFTLMNASAQDCEDYGLQESERATWVRMDDAKMNLTLASDKALWFKREGIRIQNGEVVGVLRRDELTKNAMHLKLRIAGLLIDNMIGTNTATMQLLQAVAFIKATEPLYANKTDSDVKGKLEGMFGNTIELRGHTLQVRRDPKEKTVLLVMG